MLVTAPIIVPQISSLRRVKLYNFTFKQNNYIDKINTKTHIHTYVLTRLRYE